MKKIVLSNILLLLIVVIIITNIGFPYESKMISGTYHHSLSNVLDNEAWQNEDYWEWHTRTTTDDKAYNGNHIVMNNNIITFYGYWKNSYKDFLYKYYQNSGHKIFKFTIDESKANYHTLDGAGFIFNSNILDNKLTGYILLFNEISVSIYRLDNVDITEFETTPKSTIETYGTHLKSTLKSNSKIHNLIVKTSPAKITVLEDEQEILSLDLNDNIHVGENFGLISSYVQHACSKLSTIEFSNLEITIQDFEIYLTNINNKNVNITGGYFKLLDHNGNVIKEGYSNKNGIFDMNGLNAGSYTIVQTIAPKGYKLNPIPVEFQISLDGKILNQTGKEIDLFLKNEPETFNIFLTNTDTNDILLSGRSIRIKRFK